MGLCWHRRHATAGHEAAYSGGPSPDICPFNVNMLTRFAMPEHIDVCVEAQPPIVSFHWGHPGRSTIERLHAAGCRVWEQVGSEPTAAVIDRMMADAETILKGLATA